MWNLPRSPPHTTRFDLIFVQSACFIIHSSPNTTMAKLVNIVDHFDDSPSVSDQEELVGATDFDDDLTDVDDMTYGNYCKASNERTSVCSDSGVGSGSDQPSTCSDQQPSKCRFFGSLVALFLAAFALLITFPLYMQQLSVEDKKNNAYGAILFVSTAVTALFILIAGCASYIGKWNIKLYRCPISWKRWVLNCNLR